jgi:hypothetical protein
MHADRSLVRRFMAKAGLSAAVVGMVLALFPAQASAEAPLERCTFSGALCLYDETGYGGEQFALAPLSPASGVCVDLVDHGWGESALSVINTGNSSAAMFQSSDCTGHPVEIPVGHSPSLTFSPNSVYVQG